MKLIVNKNHFKQRRKPETAKHMSAGDEADFRGWFTAAFAGLALYEIFRSHVLICLLCMFCAALYWFWAWAVACRVVASLRGSAGHGAVSPKGGAQKHAPGTISAAIGPRLLAGGMAFVVLAVPLGVLHRTTVAGEDAARHDEARRNERKGALDRQAAERLVNESLKKAQLARERAEQSRAEAARVRAEEAQKQDQMLDTVLSKYEAALWKDISLCHLKDVRHGRDTAWSIVRMDLPSRHSYGLKIVDPIRNDPAGVVIADYTKDELERLVRTLGHAEEWAAQAERNGTSDDRSSPVHGEEGSLAASQVMTCKMIGAVPLLVVDPPFGNLFLGMDQVRILKAALSSALADINRLETEAVERAVADVKDPAKKNQYL